MLGHVVWPHPKWNKQTKPDLLLSATHKRMRGILHLAFDATKAATDAAPFALYCSVLDPHPPYFTNQTWLAHVDDDALDATINATRWQTVDER